MPGLRYQSKTERRIRKIAVKKYPHNKAKQDHYTYGTMTNIKKRHDAKNRRHRAKSAKRTTR